MSERTPQEHRVTDPAGRTEPYVQGPTGPAPLASESRGDPGADEGDRGQEGGAAAGIVGGAAVGGPVGAVVGGVVGATIGAATETGDSGDGTPAGAAAREARDDRDRPEHPDDDSASNVHS